MSEEIEGKYEPEELGGEIPGELGVDGYLEEKKDPEELDSVRGLDRRVVVGIVAGLVGLFLLFTAVQLFSGSEQREEVTENEPSFREVSRSADRGIEELERRAQREGEVRDELLAMVEDDGTASWETSREGRSESSGTLRDRYQENVEEEQGSQDEEDMNNPWVQAREQARQRHAQQYHQDSFAAPRSDVFARVSRPGGPSRSEGEEEVGSNGGDLRALQRNLMQESIEATRRQQQQSLVALHDTRPRSAGERRREIYRGSEEWDSTSSSRLQEAAAFSVQAGTMLRLVLETGINSDLPGLVKGRIQSPIYDSVTGQHLLIPSGSTIIGEYQAEIGFGQERVAIAWQRLILPNGKSIGLNGLPGTDVAGQAGYADRVDTHWQRVLGAAALSSLLSTSAAVAAGPRNLLEQTPQEAALGGLSDEVSQYGRTLVDRQLDVAPTIRIRPGTQVGALVREDLLLEPYEERR